MIVTPSRLRLTRKASVLTRVLPTFDFRKEKKRKEHVSLSHRLTISVFTKESEERFDHSVQKISLESRTNSFGYDWSQHFITQREGWGGDVWFLKLEVSVTCVTEK